MELDADVTVGPEQRAVLSWAAAHRRDLPWRATRDPWAVLVSEVMLQQTQVDRVVPRWQRFLARWPDTAACARASLGDVLGEWQGLGYPRRARALHESARQIQQDHDGRFPDQLDSLLALPGVGPYTARAVLAFAFERDVAVLDTNIGRILARRAGAALSPRDAQALADGWVPPGHGWAWNQGLLDVGATRCRPSAPRCWDCPVAPWCSWHRNGHDEPDPAAGSAAVSRRQAPFAGSARQARGRLLAELTRAPLTAEQLSEHAPEVVESLVADGLVERLEDGTIRLPA
ncbi:MAG: A/G-specific adenine glycosylase [Microthrixaceae bacterium]